MKMNKKIKIIFLSALLIITGFFAIKASAATPAGFTGTTVADGSTLYKYDSTCAVGAGIFKKQRGIIVPTNATSVSKGYIYFHGLNTSTNPTSDYMCTTSGLCASAKAENSVIFTPETNVTGQTAQTVGYKDEFDCFIQEAKTKLQSLHIGVPNTIDIAGHSAGAKLVMNTVNLAPGFSTSSRVDAIIFDGCYGNWCNQIIASPHTNHVYLYYQTQDTDGTGPLSIAAYNTNKTKASILKVEAGHYRIPAKCFMDHINGDKCGAPEVPSDQGYNVDVKQVAGTVANSSKITVTYSGFTETTPARINMEYASAAENDSPAQSATISMTASSSPQTIEKTFSNLTDQTEYRITVTEDKSFDDPSRLSYSDPVTFTQSTVINGNGDNKLDCSDPKNTDNQDCKCTTGYCLLQPIAGLKTIPDSTSISTYLNIMFKIGIGLAAVLAVIMIVIGGIQYMSTDAISGKEDGKHRIKGALTGLILALGAWALLNTINPDLVLIKLDLKSAQVKIDTSSVDVPATNLTTGSPVCGGKYKVGDVWQADDVIRKKYTDTFGSSSVNVGNCKTVGQHSCTSLAGLPDSTYSGMKKLEDAIISAQVNILPGPSCKDYTCLEITGGTECWDHGNSQSTHIPGSDVVDLLNSNQLNQFLTTFANGSNNNKGYTRTIGQFGLTPNATLYVYQWGGTGNDYLSIVHETVPDHFHVLSWMGPPPAQWPKQ